MAEPLTSAAFTLPAGRFWATMPNDAMAPRLCAGQRACFDPTIAPRAGDGVLIGDAHTGHVFIRELRAGSRGKLAAHALNGECDDLGAGRQVLAVLVATEGRWTTEAARG